MDDDRGKVLFHKLQEFAASAVLHVDGITKPDETWQKCGVAYMNELYDAIATGVLTHDDATKLEQIFALRPDHSSICLMNQLCTFYFALHNQAQTLAVKQHKTIVQVIQNLLQQGFDDDITFDNHKCSGEGHIVPVVSGDPMYVCKPNREIVARYSVKHPSASPSPPSQSIKPTAIEQHVLVALLNFAADVVKLNLNLDYDDAIVAGISLFNDLYNEIANTTELDAIAFLSPKAKRLHKILGMSCHSHVCLFNILFHTFFENILKNIEETKAIGKPKKDLLPIIVQSFRRQLASFAYHTCDQPKLLPPMSEGKKMFSIVE